MNKGVDGMFKFKKKGYHFKLEITQLQNFPYFHFELDWKGFCFIVAVFCDLFEIGYNMETVWSS